MCKNKYLVQIVYLFISQIFDNSHGEIMQQQDNQVSSFTSPTQINRQKNNKGKNRST